MWLASGEAVLRKQQVQPTPGSGCSRKAMHARGMHRPCCRPTPFPAPAPGSAANTLLVSSTNDIDVCVEMEDIGPEDVAAKAAVVSELAELITVSGIWTWWRR